MAFGSCEYFDADTAEVVVEGVEKVRVSGEGEACDVIGIVGSGGWSMISFTQRGGMGNAVLIGRDEGFWRNNTTP